MTLREEWTTNTRFPIQHRFINTHLHITSDRTRHHTYSTSQAMYN